MGAVIPLVTPEAVDNAWEAYRAHAVMAHDDPTLALDRAYMEQHIRLHRKWVRLFAIDDRA